MSASLENSLEFEVVDQQHDDINNCTSQPASTIGSLEHESISRMYVSSSSIAENGEDSRSGEYEGLQNLTSSEKNARLIGRRIDILIHQSNGGTSSTWERGTILNFDKTKDVHWVLPDGQRARKEYRLCEIVFRLVETEEEWVDIGENRQSLEEDAMTDTDESL